MNRKKIYKILLIATVLLALPITVYLALTKTGFFGRAFGTNANLVVDMGSSYQTDGQSWKNLAQGGEEKEPMLASVIEKTAGLSPKYIRVDHVFDFYDVVSRSGENLVFSWGKLDRLISDITKTGAKPFISISYMPSAISSGGTTDYPESWGEWEFVVKSLVERYSGHFGISNIYYEVWNEPDLFGDFKTRGSKNYLTLYQSTVRGAESAKGVQPYKIGGPATTDYYNAWVTGLLKFSSKNNLPLDFISWHKYSYSMDDYENDWVEILETIAEDGRTIPPELVISEYGHTPEKHVGYDGTFSAIHLLAVAATLENKVNKVFTFEIKDGPADAKYSGSWGLFTHEKHGPVEAKPRYNALLFLNRMGGNKVNVAGQGSWVKAFAKNDGKVVKLFVVNYDPSGKHFEAVPITLVNLNSGRVKIKRTDYSGQVKERNYETENSFLEISEGFEANTAAIFEITSF